MFPDPSLRKLIQISEEALPSVHVPFIFGNVLFILSHHDVRKIEDTRVFSISKVMPNGDLKTINPQEAAECLQQATKQENLLSNHQMLHNLLEFLNNKSNSYQTYQQHSIMPQLQQQQYSSGSAMPHPQPMEVSSTPYESGTVASIEQQLQWNKCENASPLNSCIRSFDTVGQAFPMHYSHGTSTTEIDYEQDLKDRQAISTCSGCKMSQQCANCKKLCNKSTNTQELLKKEVLDAREQLKKKKMATFIT